MTFFSCVIILLDHLQVCYSHVIHIAAESFQKSKNHEFLVYTRLPTFRVFFSVPFQVLMIPILNPAWECGQTNTGMTSLTGKGIRASLPPWTLGQTLTTRLVIRFNLSNLTYVYRRVTKRQLFHL